MKKGTIIGLLVLLGPALQAQVTMDYRLKTGLVSAVGDMVNLTNRHLGYFFEGGVNLDLQSPKLALFAHVGHLAVRRDELDAGNYADVKNTWVGVDLLYPVNKKFDLFTGPTLNTWDVTALTGPYDDTSWKLGWRLGGRYAFTKHWGVEGIYNIAEYARLQRKNRNGTLKPVEALRPSWFTVGVSYTF
jgi:hypothetical protein